MPSFQPRVRPAELEAWLLAARAGSSEALGRILESCRPYLLLIANQELDSDLKAKVSPSDLVQESCAKAQAAFARFDGHRPELLAWLRQILLNELAGCRERYRQTRKRDLSREVPLVESPPSLTGGLIDPAPTPQARAVAAEERVAVERALERLPERYRRVVRLRYLEDRSFGEVGHELGCSADAARKVWLRALVQLKALLESNP